MLYDVLSEFPQHILPLPCNVCIGVMSEHCQSDGVTVSPYRTSVIVVTSFEFIDKLLMKFMRKHRLCVKQCYDECQAYKL